MEGEEPSASENSARGKSESSGERKARKRKRNAAVPGRNVTKQRERGGKWQERPECPTESCEGAVTVKNAMTQRERAWGKHGKCQEQATQQGRQLPDAQQLARGGGQRKQREAEAGEKACVRRRMTEQPAPCEEAQRQPSRPRRRCKRNGRTRAPAGEHARTTGRRKETRGCEE